MTSDAGNFTAGPVSVTIVGGQLITKDITVTFARNEGGLTGSVSAVKVPPSIQFRFSAVYACDGTTQFTTGGTPKV